MSDFAWTAAQTMGVFTFWQGDLSGSLSSRSGGKHSSKHFQQAGEALPWQPRLLVRDMRGLPVPGRKVPQRCCC